MENMAESKAEDDVQVQVNIKDSQFLSFLQEISLEKYQEDFIKTGISDININLLRTRLKTHRLFQVDIDRRKQCCAANYEQVVNHAVPSCYS